MYQYELQFTWVFKKNFQQIRIDYGQYIHASIFRHLSGSTEVLDIEVGKSLADPLV